MRLSFVVRRILEKEKRVKIAILGPDNAGKTSLLRSFTGEQVEKISPTFGYQTVVKDAYIGEKKYSLEILDIGGQESIRSYWDTYYSGIDAVLYVYDTHGTDLYRGILESVISHPSLRGAAFICAANKHDSEKSAEDAGPPVRLESAADKEIKIRSYRIDEELPFNFLERMEDLKISQAAEEKSVPIVYTSAKTGKNVQHIFKRLLRMVIEKREKDGIL